MEWPIYSITPVRPSSGVKPMRPSTLSRFASPRVLMPDVP